MHLATQPEPSIDHVAKMGIGTKQVATPQNLAERELPVSVTNPSMRAAESGGPAVREEPRRMTARRMDVAVRSGNQRPSEVMGVDTPGSFIWGYKGTGDAEDEGKKADGRVGLVLLAVVGTWLFWPRRETKF
jgi:hypothetical protein